MVSFFQLFEGGILQTVNEALDRLERSKFRSSFHLNKEDFEYISTKGTETVRRHAEDFVRERLAPAFPKNDGSQTPMKGHPVFKAQHACGCCCRGCLEKWYRVKKGLRADGGSAAKNRKSSYGVDRAANSAKQPFMSDFPNIFS